MNLSNKEKIIERILKGGNFFQPFSLDLPQVVHEDDEVYYFTDQIVDNLSQMGSNNRILKSEVVSLGYWYEYEGGEEQGGITFNGVEWNISGDDILLFESSEDIVEEVESTLETDQNLLMEILGDQLPDHLIKTSSLEFHVNSYIESEVQNLYQMTLEERASIFGIDFEDNEDVLREEIGEINNSIDHLEGSISLLEQMLNQSNTKKFVTFWIKKLKPSYRSHLVNKQKVESFVQKRLSKYNSQDFIENLNISWQYVGDYIYERFERFISLVASMAQKENQKSTAYKLAREISKTLKILIKEAEEKKEVFLEEIEEAEISLARTLTLKEELDDYDWLEGRVIVQANANGLDDGFVEYMANLYGSTLYDLIEGWGIEVDIEAVIDINEANQGSAFYAKVLGYSDIEAIPSDSEPYWILFDNY